MTRPGRGVPPVIAPGTCQQCDGSGWVDTGTPSRHGSTEVVPCRCSHGRSMADVHDLIRRSHNPEHPGFNLAAEQNYRRRAGGGS